MSREFTIHPDALARMKMLMHSQAKANQTRSQKEPATRARIEHRCSERWRCWTQVSLRITQCFQCQQLGLPVTMIRRW